MPLLRRLVWTVAAVGLASPAAHAQAKLPGQLASLAIEQRPGAQVPHDASFRDEAGGRVQLGDVLGERPVILVLAYYRCPRLCSVVLTELVDSLRQLPLDAGSGFTVVVVSFDPREGPELAAAAKASYLERYRRPRVQAGWHFWTGDESETRRLADVVGFQFAFDRERNEYVHASGLTILTPKGTVARYLFGVRFPPDDLRLALVEASEGKIAAPLDRALLLGCLGYDPATGTYKVMAMKLLRLGAVATLALVGLYLVRQWRRDGRSASLKLVGPGAQAAEVRSRESQSQLP